MSTPLRPESNGDGWRRVDVATIDTNRLGRAWRLVLDCGHTAHRPVTTSGPSPAPPRSARCATCRQNGQTP